MGDPVSHSRSPVIHTAAFAALGIDATYEARRVVAGAFGDVVDDLDARRLDGVNVTMPHKRHAFEAASALSDGAERTGAVNTLLPTDGVLHGDNTDIHGVRHAVSTLGDLRYPRVVVLGSGGAARAAIVAVEGPIAVMARSPEQGAEALRTTGAEDGDVLAWGEEVDGALVINATPVGMHGEMLPTATLTSAGGVVDMAYGAQATPTIRWAEHHGIPHADGLVMLVGQAARAFELFVGRPAPIDVMSRAVRLGVPGSPPGAP